MSGRRRGFDARSDGCYYFFNGEASKEVILQFSSSCLHNFLQVNTRKLHPTQGSKMEQSARGGNGPHGTCFAC